jgi:hypothetical protein
VTFLPATATASVPTLISIYCKPELVLIVTGCDSFEFGLCFVSIFISLLLLLLFMHIYYIRIKHFVNSNQLKRGLGWGHRDPLKIALRKGGCTMRNGFYQFPKLPRIACVSPRIYQTIHRLLNKLIRPQRKHLVRQRIVTLVPQNNSFIPATKSLLNKGWLLPKFNRPPHPAERNKYYFWKYVKTAEEYQSDQISKEQELILKRLL